MWSFLAALVSQLRCAKRDTPQRLDVDPLTQTCEQHPIAYQGIYTTGYDPHPQYPNPPSAAGRAGHLAASRFLSFQWYRIVKRKVNLVYLKAYWNEVGVWLHNRRRYELSN